MVRKSCLGGPYAPKLTRVLHPPAVPQPGFALRSCIGCSYSNPTNCCCGKRKAVTRTTTVVSTVTKGRQFRAEVAPLVRDLRRRSVNNEVTLSENEDFDEVPSIISRLFGRQKDSGRHLCPVCPTGATIRTNGTSGTFCCPRAAPTIWKTKTRFVTKTAKTSKTSGTVGRVATITGRVWIDLNRNNKFDLGVDIPYSYTPVSLIKPSAVGKRGLEERAPLNSVLGNTTTDCEGNFRFFTATPEDNKLLWVTLQTDMSKPLKTLQTDSRGFGAALVPLPAALPVTVTSTVYSVGQNERRWASSID